ncbi:MAG: DUF4097 family beta strand repeat-containing protein [Phycisphaerales bacterium]
MTISSSCVSGLRRGALVLASAGLLLAAGDSAGCSLNAYGDQGGWGWGDTVKETRVMTVAAVAGKPINVKSKNGGVSIKATERADVMITAKLQAKTKERLATVKLIAERTADGTLTVRPEWPEGDAAWRKSVQGDGCTFEIEVPDAVGVVVDTSNGGISISGLSGAAVLESSNGGVDVNEHAGDLTIDTSNGGVSVEGIDGALKIDTSNAGVDVKDVLGAVAIDTSNGGVNVELAAENAGPVVIESSNGAVDLTVGPAFKGTLVLDTSNGTVSVPAGLGKVVSKSKSSAKVEVGDGPKSVVDTSNGSVSVSLSKKG